MSQTSTTKARAPWLPLAAAGVTVLLWASAFVAIRDATPHFSPGALALGRLAVGSITLGVMLLIRREGLPPRAAWPGIVTAGILWFGLYMIALNWGERSVDAGTAAMVVAIGPILIALLSGWLLNEGFPPRLLAGIAVAFVGAAVVGYSVSGGSSSSTVGVLLCLVAAVSFAGGVVSEKPALRHASASQVTTFACLVGAIACLPFSGQLVSQLAKAPASATLNIVYLGLCARPHHGGQDGRHHLRHSGRRRLAVVGLPGRAPDMADGRRWRAVRGRRSRHPQPGQVASRRNNRFAIRSSRAGQAGSFPGAPGEAG